MAQTSSADATSLAPQRPEYLHIIDEDGTISNEVGPFIQRSGLIDKGSKFSIISIMGGQHGGKSTLLNLLFGTIFDVMDENRIAQTTKGIWMAKTKLDDSLVVMDLEGLDSREHGEAGVVFERKITLFAMALSNVLMVNMMRSDLGRRNAANVPLLQTVMEINLNLFQHDSSRKTLLMFVIRDDHRRTPFSELKRIISEDLQTIWTGINKPENCASKSVTDFFDLDFVSLPSKFGSEDQFIADVDNLKHRFVDSSAADFLFKNETQFTQAVPADGFAHYATQIWQAIQENKDLDLPNQRDMVAQYRCEEVKNQAVQKYQDDVKDIRTQVKSGWVDGMGATFEKLLNDAVATYDQTAVRYKSPKVQEIRNSLKTLLLLDMQQLFNLQIVHLKKQTLAKFRSSLKAAVPSKVSDSKAIRAFGAASSSFLQAAFSSFDKGVAESKLPDADWEISSTTAELRSTLASERADEIAKQSARLVTYYEKQIGDQLQGRLRPVLDKADPGKMWASVNETFAVHLETFLKNLSLDLQGLSCSAEEVAQLRRQLQDSAFSSLVDVFKQAVAREAFKAKLVSIFLNAFRRDSNGLPRYFKTEQEVDQAYLVAKEKALAVLDLFETLQVKEPLRDGETDSEETAFKVLLDPETKTDVKGQFEKESENAFMETKRSVTDPLATFKNIPMWMYGALLILGLNEIYAVLTNPLLFVLALLVIGLVVVMQVPMLRGMLSASLQGVLDHVMLQIIGPRAPSSAPAFASSSGTAVEMQPLSKSS